MARKKNAVEADAPQTEAPESIPTPAAESAQIDADPASAPTPKKRGRKPKGDLTLSNLAEGYLAHMEDAGKSSGTVFSYRLELQTALAALGADTKLADLTSKDVVVFFGSAKVNKARTGKPKSPLSIAKTQRVLRLALVWAVDAGLIEKAPLPEDLATH